MQRLLDHEQVELVERTEDVEVVRACTRRSRRPTAAMSGCASRTAADALHVQARLDLQLDAPVPLGEVAVDLVAELLAWCP